MSSIIIENCTVLDYIDTCIDFVATIRTARNDTNNRIAAVSLNTAEWVQLQVLIKTNYAGIMDTVLIEPSTPYQLHYKGIIVFCDGIQSQSTRDFEYEINNMKDAIRRYHAEQNEEIPSALGNAPRIVREVSMSSNNYNIGRLFTAPIPASISARPIDFGMTADPVPAEVISSDNGSSGGGGGGIIRTIATF